MGDPEKRLECRDHGEAYATFVCQHIAVGTGQGFNYGNLEDPRPDAWCDACDLVLMACGGEWNDSSEALAGVTMICSECYDRARLRNERPGPSSRGGRASHG